MNPTPPADNPHAVRRTGHFETFVAEHHDALLRFCVRVAGNSWDGEDLAQETIARVFPKLADPAPLRDPGAYLRRTAINIWRDELRRRARPLPDAEEAAAVRPLEMGDEARAALVRMLECLSPQQRVLVLLADVLGFPLSEVATFLVITPGAARVALHRARKRLEEHAGNDAVEQARIVDEELIDRLHAALRDGDARKIGQWLLERAPTEAEQRLHYEPADVDALFPQLRWRAERRAPSDLVWVSGDLDALPEGIQTVPRTSRFNRNQRNNGADNG